MKNAADKTAKEPEMPAAKASPATDSAVDETASVRRAATINAAEATYTGETNVERGALARAEARVAAASGGGAYPQAGDQPTKVWVDSETGAVVDDPNALGPRGGTQLVGAEAEAYKAAHGGKKAEAKASGEKQADEKPNKARKARATKSK